MRKNRRLIIGALLTLTLSIPMVAAPSASASADSVSASDRNALARQLAAAKKSAALSECPADPARCMKTTVTPKAKKVAQPADPSWSD